MTAKEKLLGLLAMVEGLAACPDCGAEHPDRYRCTIGLYQSDPMRKLIVLARDLRKELDD